MLSTISPGVVPSSAGAWQPGHRGRFTPDDIDAMGLPILASAWRAGGAGTDSAIRQTYETLVAAGDNNLAEILTKRASIIDTLMRSGGQGVVAVQVSDKSGNGGYVQIMTPAEFERDWVRGEGFSSGEPEPSADARAFYEEALKLPIMRMVADQLARMRPVPAEEVEAERRAMGGAAGDPDVDETARKGLTDVLGEGWEWTMAASGTTSDGTRVTVGIISGVDRSTVPPDLARGKTLEVLT